MTRKSLACRHYPNLDTETAAAVVAAVLAAAAAAAVVAAAAAVVAAAAAVVSAVVAVAAVVAAVAAVVPAAAAAAAAVAAAAVVAAAAALHRCAEMWLCAGCLAPPRIARGVVRGCRHGEMKGGISPGLPSEGTDPHARGYGCARGTGWTGRVSDRGADPAHRGEGAPPCGGSSWTPSDRISV